MQHRRSYPPGMSYKAANDSLKGALKAAKDANLAECDYVKWAGLPDWASWSSKEILRAWTWVTAVTFRRTRVRTSAILKHA